MATPTDVRDALVKADVEEDAALEIQRRPERRSGPSAMSILVGATAAGFGLLAIGIGWVKSDVAETRTELRGEIAANRERIDVVADRVDAVSERPARIETLLEERLPERR
ncbi:MAG: hypothetical protein F4Y84_15670 [Caldilineaceae bacterium SB0665_bin_25]|nr:hypothetical protein [Caldilineaceae bacterium SB0665_bin_25]